MPVSRWPPPRSSPRADHPISRSMIDPDALKVLYRLHQFNHIGLTSSAAACATCCSDAGRKTSTSARPRTRYEVKRLFRNCWIIGRRFRLAHVRFGRKTIEVATFRRQVSERGARRAGSRCDAGTAGEQAAPRAEPDDGAIGRMRIRATTPSARRKRTRSAATSPSTRSSTTSRRSRSSTTPAGSRICRRASSARSAIPNVRFQEDPVRMLRAVVLAARLDFTIDPRRSSTRSRARAAHRRRPRRRG